MPPDEPNPEPNPEPSGQALPRGTRIEEFVIERVLGSGGFGITYLAKDNNLGRQVVIKENLPVQFCFRDPNTLTVAPRHSVGEDMENFRWSLENFSKEAAMLASLDHPGIVRVLRSFQALGTAYFVMPFVEGVAFDSLIESHKSKRQSFDEDGLRGLLTRMLDALGYLHDRGIYHRDIKPGNILITTAGVPVLIDFGSARQRLSERSMTVVESAGYTPFEQLQSRGNVGPWSDLYALGGTLAKAITGEAPPKAMDRMRRDPLVPLTQRSELTARFSATFLGAIDRALAVEETERWQNAGEWLAGLAVRGKSTIEVHLPDPGKARRSQTQRTPGTQRIDSITPTKKINPLPWIIAACVILGLVAWAKLASINETNAAASKAEQQRLADVTAAQALVAQAKAKEDAAKVAEQQRLAALAAAQAKAKEEAAKAEAARVEQNRLAALVAAQPYVNSLGMKFVPVKITGGPSAGKQVLFNIWQTRVQDYRKYAVAKSGVDGEWKDRGFVQGENYPVVNVSWEDAVAFCDWLTQQERSTGKIPATAKYRLPTDHEWSCAVGIGARENAAASPQSKDDKLGDVYPWGTQWPPPKGAGNYAPSLQVDEFEYTSPVGSFPANACGLYDLGGNAWEWCDDLYSATSTARVRRGGSWLNNARVILRSACRVSDDPRSRGVNYGFRVVLVVGAG